MIDLSDFSANLRSSFNYRHERLQNMLQENAVAVFDEPWRATEAAILNLTSVTLYVNNNFETPNSLKTLAKEWKKSNYLVKYMHFKKITSNYTPFK